MIQIDFNIKPEINFGYIVDKRGNKYLYDENGLLHSYDDLPAIIWFTGIFEWYKHGVHHRDNDFPAVVSPSGYKSWWKNGILHRNNDLPAIIWPNGYKEYWTYVIRKK